MPTCMRAKTKLAAKKRPHIVPRKRQKNTASFLAETQDQHSQHFLLRSWQLRAEMANYVAHGRLSERKLIELKHLLLSSFFCLQFMLTWSDSVLG